jgi:flagellar hook-associated protein 2
MEVESEPLRVLQRNRSDLEARLSDYGRLKNALGELRSAAEALGSTNAFNVFTVDNSAEHVLRASAGSSAGTGSYSVEVLRLAQAHKLGSAARADADQTTVGSAGDRMRITIDGDAFEIEYGGKTLQQIRDAINDAADNVGVTAGIVKVDDSTFHLTLTARETGTANAVSLSFIDAGGNAIADPFGFTTIVDAQDAELRVDGTYTVTRASNTIRDAVQGVTLELLQADPGSPATLTIGRDREAVREKVQALVDAYNGLRDLIGELRGSRLSGDNTLLSVESALRSVLNQPPSSSSGPFMYLSEVGLSLDKNGVMSLAEGGGALDDALATDYEAVARLFGGPDGYASRMEETLDRLVRSGDGLLELREQGINDRIDRVDDRIESMQRRLELVEQRYRAQFTMLDTLMSELQVTGNFLTRQLDQLSALSGKRS